MSIRKAAFTVFVLIGGGAAYASVTAARTDANPQEVVVTITRSGDTIVASPNPVRISRGQRLDWDNTLGGDVNIYFESGELFGPQSRRGQAGLRGQRRGQSRGRAVGLVRAQAAAGRYKYDIEAFDTEGNRFFIDPEVDCC